jgi:hypothetical protein
MWWLETAWSVVWGYVASVATIDIVVGCVAVAVAVLLPKPLDFVTDLRKWAIGVAIIAFTLAGAIAHGYKIGRAEVKGEWDAALAREVAAVEKADVDAVRDIGPITHDRGVFRSDPDNRNRDGRKNACE